MATRIHEEASKSFTELTVRLQQLPVAEFDTNVAKPPSRRAYFALVIHKSPQPLDL